VESVVTQFILDPPQDENAASHADGQPGNIDCGEGLVADDVPYGDLEVVLKHGWLNLVFLARQEVTNSMPKSKGVDI
jgi:hypothetical protein